MCKYYNMPQRHYFLNFYQLIPYQSNMNIYYISEYRPICELQVMNMFVLQSVTCHTWAFCTVCLRSTLK